MVNVLLGEELMIVGKGLSKGRGLSKTFQNWIAIWIWFWMQNRKMIKILGLRKTSEKFCKCDLRLKMLKICLRKQIQVRVRYTTKSTKSIFLRLSISNKWTFKMLTFFCKVFCLFEKEEKFRSNCFSRGHFSTWIKVFYGT
jgi:hypothetical protein